MAFRFKAPALLVRANVRLTKLLVITNLRSPIHSVSWLCILCLFVCTHASTPVLFPPALTEILASSGLPPKLRVACRHFADGDLPLDQLVYIGNAAHHLCGTDGKDNDRLWSVLLCASPFVVFSLFPIGSVLETVHLIRKGPFVRQRI